MNITHSQTNKAKETKEIKKESQNIIKPIVSKIIKFLYILL